MATTATTPTNDFKARIKNKMNPARFILRHNSSGIKTEYDPENLIADIYTAVIQIYPKATFVSMEISGNRIFVEFKKTSLKMDGGMVEELKAALKVQASDWKGLGLSPKGIESNGSSLVIPIRTTMDYRFSVAL